MEKCVPIIEITDENFEAMFPAISNAISESSFIALDCELSGLGNRSKLNCSEIDLRYQNTKDLAQEYSIVSLGISCFTCQSCSSVSVKENGGDQSVKTQNYLVQTFNILTLCSPRYVVETDSIKFLLSHGFDFNRQYTHGLPYSRGEFIRADQKDKEENWTVKNIFHLIIKHRKPIVLHNGFVDLVFLYQSFYTDLPKKLETFAADLLQMFPAGVYDTKYISEFQQSFPATFLEYVFKRMQLENEDRKNSGKWHSRIKFPPYPKNGVIGLGRHPYLDVFQDLFDEDPEASKPLCISYKFHGWCSKENACEMSHNTNRMARELSNCSSRRKRKKANLIGHSSVAQLISMKKQKLEKSKTRAEKDIVVLEEENKDKVVSQENGGSTSAKDNITVDVSNVFIDISEEDHEKDVTILDNDEDSVQEVFSTEEVSPAQSADINQSDNVSCGKSKRNKSERPSDINSTKNSISGYESVERNAGDQTSEESEDELQNKTSNKMENRDNNGGHSAGYDAFMTGFIFACDVAALGNLVTPSSFKDPKEMSFHHVSGRVYLIGKDFPFLIRSSNYVTTSSSHDRLIELLRKEEL